MIACPARGEDGVQIEADVVYGHKVGMALTYDVIRPEKDANGKGILFMVSGGWFSPWFPPEAVMGRAGLPSTTLKALVDRGFTLFLVRHGSGEKFLVPDAVDDVRRAALHVRRHAERYEVEPERLGVVGMSAGGHLSLMLGTTAAKVEARPGEQADDAPDKPVVAAVVAFFPPTDLHDYVTDEKFRRQFPALQFDASLAASVSPLKHVTSDDAPALMIHGTKDDLVPIKHSHDMHEALKASGVEANVLVIDEAGHGFQGEDELRATKATVDWFAEHLLAGETEATQP
jgi:acetyl esterase/lipase